MGNQQTKLGTNLTKDLQFFEFLQDIDDYRFGRAQLWIKKGTKNSNNPEYVIVKEKWSMTELDYKQYEAYMATRRNIRHENLANLVSYENFVENNWCSKYYKTHIVMEYSPESLADELLRKRRLTRDDPNKWMSEPEMWYIIRGVSTAAAELLRHNLNHGDIQPRHILITNEETIKLFEAPVLSQYFTGANRMLQETDYNAAVSPQELEALRKDLVFRTLNPGLNVHNPDDKINLHQGHGKSGHTEMQMPLQNSGGDQIKRSHLQGHFPDQQVRHLHNEKDDVFSLGITLLCAAANNPLSDFYDYKRLTLNREKIQQKLAFMRELGFSQQLIGLVTSMLQEDPNQRIGLGQILQVAGQPQQFINPATGQQVQPPGIPVRPGQQFPQGPGQQPMPGQFATSQLINPGQQNGPQRPQTGPMGPQGFGPSGPGALPPRPPGVPNAGQYPNTFPGPGQTSPAIPPRGQFQPQPGQSQFVR